MPNPAAIASVPFPAAAPSWPNAAGATIITAARAANNMTAFFIYRLLEHAASGWFPALRTATGLTLQRQNQKRKI
jgi:hypothetical protein